MIILFSRIKGFHQPSIHHRAGQSLAAIMVQHCPVWCSTVRYSAALSGIAQHCPVQYSTIRYSAALSGMVQHCPVRCSTVRKGVPHCKVWWSTVRFGGVLSGMVRHCRVWCSIVWYGQYSTVRYGTVGWFDFVFEALACCLRFFWVHYFYKYIYR